MKYTLLSSLVLHSILLFYTSSKIIPNLPNSPNSEKEKSQKRTKVTFIPKEETSSIVKNNSTKKSIEKKTSNYNIDTILEQLTSRCDKDYYYGIGITIGLLNKGGDVVDEIAPGYAADRAGIIIGDIILGYFDENGVWKVGTKDLRQKEIGDTNKPIVIKIQRNYINMDIVLIREKICILPKTNP